jgi:hypothetical protein
MAEYLAGFARARRAGAWFSASPRVQRFAAAQVAVLLGVALSAVALQPRPGAPAEPLALAAATGPASAPVVVHAEPVRTRPVRPAVSRSPVQRRRPTTRPLVVKESGWAYWSIRIRGCESHGRPDARADYKAQNPHSTASGAYQITDATWAGRYGVSHASDATPEQQDAAAADLYRRHGTADWSASGACWRTK